MIQPILPALGLAALAFAGAVPAEPPTTSPVRAIVAVDDWAGVLEAYTAALDAWQADYDTATDVKTRRAMRDEHPARAFWERVEAQADAGEGRALVWMLENAGHAGHKGKRGREVKAGVYARLFPAFLEAEWFERVIALLANDRRSVGDERFEEYLGAAVADATQVGAVARAELALGTWLLKSDDPGRLERAWALLESAAERAGTDAATEAGELLYVRRNLSVGAVAPNFQAATVDGGAFSLEDFRGKVVVLDFFGFW